MAKKPNSAPTALTFRDLVLGAEAGTLRQALEARLRIDELIAERQAAYERIATLETQVEDVIGEPGIFPFPAPPLPVAGLDAKSDTLTRSTGTTPAKKSAARPAPAAQAGEDDDNNDDDNLDDTSPAADRASDDDEDNDDDAKA